MNNFEENVEGLVDRGGRHDQMWRPLSLEVNFHPHDSFDEQVMMVDDGGGW